MKLRCSRESATGPFLESDESTAHLLTLHLQNPIIHTLSTACNICNCVSLGLYTGGNVKCAVGYNIKVWTRQTAVFVQFYVIWQSHVYGTVKRYGCDHHESATGNRGIAPVIVSVGTRWRWICSIVRHPALLLGGWVDPRADLGILKKKRVICPCWELNYNSFFSVAWSLYWLSYLVVSILSRGQLKCDDTHAETTFRLLAKQTSPFKSAGVSVQSTTGSRGVRISGSNVAYTMFRGGVKGTGYPLHSPVSLSLPLPASPCAITFQLESTTTKHVANFSQYKLLK
jgi:hypothetical protein